MVNFGGQNPFLDKAYVEKEKEFNEAKITRNKYRDKLLRTPVTHGQISKKIVWKDSNSLLKK